MDFLEVAKYGVSGLALGLVYVLNNMINGSSKERIEVQKMMSVVLADVAKSLDKNTESSERIASTVGSLDQYIRIRNGISDKTNQALSHALGKLGVDVPEQQK
jgi:hypothetical protein